MTQHYVGVKIVLAYEQDRDGKPGYVVRYEDGYESWSPKDVFEKHYLPMGEKPGGLVNDNTVTVEMVEGFVASLQSEKSGDRTTIVTAEGRNGFIFVEGASCVDPATYNHETGVEICRERIWNKLWKLLGFVVAWGRRGIR